MSEDEIKQLRLSPPKIMSERELAIVTGLSPRTVRTYTNKRVIPVSRIGKRKLYRLESVMDALDRLEK